MSALFVAGAGTDVGKTHVTCGLIRSLRAAGAPVRALKPLVSGFDPDDWAQSDSGRLLAALGQPLDGANLEVISPWRYRAPLAPDMAAVREGRAVDPDAIFGFCRQAIAAPAPGWLLIEGVGGAMSPIEAHLTNLDWMRGLGLPVLLVGGSYLGAISHTLTAIEALRRTDLTIAAVVISESPDSAPFDETVASLTRLSSAPIIGVRRDAADADWTGALLPILNQLDERARGA